MNVTSMSAKECHITVSHVTQMRNMTPHDTTTDIKETLSNYMQAFSVQKSQKSDFRQVRNIFKHLEHLKHRRHVLTV